MVSVLMSTPLDYSKPLWQFQYIENYREARRWSHASTTASPTASPWSASCSA